MLIKFNVIGAGRLGTALALSLIKSGQGQLMAVCNANFNKAKLAVEKIGSGIAVSRISELPAADLTFITTPDDLITQVAKQLASEKILPPHSLVAHCSGVLSTNALSSLKKISCHLASIHPLKAFKSNNDDSFIFNQCDCVIEGDSEAVNIITVLFSDMGARVIPIKPEDKMIYHAAAVMSSNYLVTLAATAIQLFNQAGISKSLAKEITQNLMTSSLNNIKQSEIAADALTGPLQRGDLNTIKKHLAILPASFRDLYSSAALATLPLTTLSDELKEEIKALMSS
ncbi:MAG: DUF2520 domain-containing protein [Tatlockia sp.]|nr:DUF2520 domain-containing protein [Tatlockia sp.]